ncbi:hypothetical protein ACW9UR_22385 [Halovulum sp. GXIMD14794]
MFLELVATFAAALVAAGLALILRRITGGRLPRWLVPIFAGLAMIGYTIWSEYTWAGRTAGGLPEGVTVVDRVAETFVYKPWTYLAPQTTRLIALDHAGMQTNPATPDVRLADVYLFERWQPTARRPQLIDCAAAARADVTEAAIDAPESAEWLAVGAEDPLVQSACGG